MRNFSVRFDRKLHRVARKLLYCASRAVSRGIVGVRLRRGAGFFVSGAQACGSAGPFAAGGGLHAHHVEAHLEIARLASIAKQLRD